MKAQLHSSRLFCICCGKEGIPIIRKANGLKAGMHRKRLYCIHCKEETNHIEIRNDEEKNQFLEAFSKGEYVQEAQESLQYIKEHKGRFL